MRLEYKVVKVSEIKDKEGKFLGSSIKAERVFLGKLPAEVSSGGSLSLFVPDPSPWEVNHIFAVDL